MGGVRSLHGRRAPIRAPAAAYAVNGSNSSPRKCSAGLKPDCTLLLDLPVEKGLERVRLRSGPAPTDRFEEEPAKFFERVRDAYLDDRAGRAATRPDR